MENLTMMFLMGIWNYWNLKWFSWKENDLKLWSWKKKGKESVWTAKCGIKIESLNETQLH